VCVLGGRDLLELVTCMCVRVCACLCVYVYVLCIGLSQAMACRA